MEQVIQEHRKAIVKNLDKYRKSKQALMSRIILPFLERLNWDTRASDEVEFDFTTGDYTADIALLYALKKPFCLINVVKPFTPRTQEFEELKAQCKAVKCPGILTDGLDWIFIRLDGFILYEGDVIHPESIDLIRMLRRENCDEYSLFAHLMTRQKLNTPLVKAWEYANEQNDLRKILKAFRADFKDYVDAYQGEEKEFLSEKYIHKFLKDYLHIHVMGGTPDAKLVVTFPDNKVITHQYGKNVLIECIKKLGVKDVFEKANYRLSGQGETATYLITKEAPKRTHEILTGSDNQEYYIQTGDPNREKEKYLRHFRNELKIDEMKITYWTI